MSKIKEFLIPTITLFVICLVASLLLGITNEVTAPIIEKNDAETQQKAMAAVMPEGKDFTETGSNDYGTYAIVKDDAGAVIGYAVTAVGKGGYDGDIKLMVGINADGTVKEIDGVAAISVLANSETPSVGGKIIKDIEWFKQFIGISGSADLSKNGGKIDAVSGATKTSTGITDAVNNALLCYQEVSANG